MSKSKRKNQKPKGSPLTLHPNGQWVKKIKGKLYYFGTNHDQAVKSYFEQVQDIIAGRSPTPKVNDSQITLRRGIEAWINAKKMALQRDDLRPRTFEDYRRSADQILAVFNPERPVVSLTPADFEKLLASVGHNWGPVRRAKFVTHVKMIFHWMKQNRLIDREMEYGTEFRKPSLAARRRAKRSSMLKLYSPQEIRNLIDHSGVQMKAMILLGINGGFGNTDCANLPIEAVDWENGIIDWPRPKTGIDRVVPLWPETLQALISVRLQRPLPARGQEGYLFLTKRGRQWVREAIKEGNTLSITDSVITEFEKVRKACGYLYGGRGFYSLRSTFRTVADEVHDQPAIDRIMGHQTPGMGARYVQRISLDRLRAVVDHVREWLFTNSDEIDGNA